MSYLELHKLQLTGEPYSVSRVIDEDHQASPDCQLPDFDPLDLDLPSLDILMPPLECRFDVDTPLIPLPYFEGCIPSFSGGVSITSCNSDLAIDVITPIGINQVGDCDYELEGDIELCVSVPCPSGISGGGTISFGKNGSGTGIDVSGSGTLTVSPCSVTLDGDLMITDNVTCPGKTEIDVGADITAGSAGSLLGYTITINPDINLDTSSAGDCQVNIALSGTIGVSVSGSGPPTKTIAACSGFGGVEEIEVYIKETV